MLADDEENDGGSVNVYGKLEAKKVKLYSRATTNKSLDENLEISQPECHRITLPRDAGYLTVYTFQMTVTETGDTPDCKAVE